MRSVQGIAILLWIIIEHSFRLDEILGDGYVFIWQILLRLVPGTPRVQVPAFPGIGIGNIQ